MQTNTMNRMIVTYVAINTLLKPVDLPCVQNHCPAGSKYLTDAAQHANEHDESRL